jgi:hypothetical protein
MKEKIIRYEHEIRENKLKDKENIIEIKKKSKKKG